jgi:hypothetical protein
MSVHDLLLDCAPLHDTPTIALLLMLLHAMPQPHTDPRMMTLVIVKIRAVVMKDLPSDTSLPLESILTKSIYIVRDPHDATRMVTIIGRTIAPVNVAVRVVAIVAEGAQGWLLSVSS